MANTNPYLTLSSPNSFTLATANSTKNWDGQLEYSLDLANWDVWDGTTALSSTSASPYVLYLRGAGNSVISGNSIKGWNLTGNNISCSGNIENLLDYATITIGGHPTMDRGCFGYMFYNCTCLTTPPELSATTLASQCYMYMFCGCTSLTSAPELPATTLMNACYWGMFKNCTSLTLAPKLPATTLADYCCQEMFGGCTSLLHIPYLKANALTSNCYQIMFKNIGITISETKSSTTPYPYRVPLIGDGTTATDALTNMFSGVAGNIPTPEINKTYYLSYKPIGGLEVKEVKKGNDVIDIKHYHIYTDSTLTENAYIDSAFGAEALYDAYGMTDTEYNTLTALIG